MNGSVTLNIPQFYGIFRRGLETWTSYTERLEQYFEVNAIAEDKKVPALLTLLGGKNTIVVHVIIAMIFLLYFPIGLPLRSKLALSTNNG
jgi:hypothetical protein